MSLSSGGEHLGLGDDVSVGELRPTLHTLHDDAARRHWVEVANLRDTFHEGGVELLEERRPYTLPERAFALPTPQEIRIPCLIFTPRGVDQQLKIFCNDFFVAAVPLLGRFPPPHVAIPCFHKPPKHNVAVPINKVEGQLGRGNPVRGGVRVAHHPMRGFEKGFGAEGGFTRNEGGAHEAPRYHCKAVVL